MNLISLPREQYEYYELHYTYTSDEYYTAALSGDNNDFAFQFKREKLPEPISRSLYDTLYQPYWQDAVAFGVKLSDDGEFAAYLEIEKEHWNNRLRITQILVKEEYRRHGIGRFLIEQAKKIAVEEDFRLLVLETQSCNTKAIDFYLSQGFAFAGTNLYFYSNDDISEKEVMLEMVYLL